MRTPRCLACALDPLLLAATQAARADVSLLVTNATTHQVLRFDATSGAYLGVFAQDTGTVSGLAYGPDNNLYVSNLDSQTVEEFNGTTGVSLSTFVGPSGGLLYPHDLTFGPGGNLYVASGETGSIREYDGTTGAFLGTFASGGGLVHPTGLVFHGGDLFVSSGPNGEILEYNASTGAFVATFATGNGLNGPAGLAFNAAGNLYVANFSADDVLKFDASGSYLSVVASGHGLGEAAGVAFGPDENLYVTSYATNTILEFDGVSGQYIKTFASGVGLNGPTHLIFTSSPVPEPCGLVLLGLGAVGSLVSLKGRSSGARRHGGASSVPGAGVVAAAIAASREASATGPGMMPTTRVSSVQAVIVVPSGQVRRTSCGSPRLGRRNITTTIRR